MKNIYYLTGCLMLLGACNNSKYDLENLVPQEYHKILYIKDSGKQSMTLYDTNENQNYTLNVVKSGSDLLQTANVNIQVLSQDEVDKSYSEPEAENYKVLTPECFTLDTQELVFASNDLTKSVNISINPDEVKKFIEDNPDAKWVLPFKATSENDSINSEMNELFLQITGVVMPNVEFTNVDVEVQEYQFEAVPVFDNNISIRLNTENKWEINCGLTVDESYVATYNEKNNSVFRLMPEGSYTVPESVTLSSVTSVDFTVTIDGSKLNQTGDYILPIRISDVSRFEISPDKNVYPILVRVVAEELDRTGWTATADSEEQTGEGSNGPAQMALDGDLGTYWHSIWQTGSGRRSLPYTIIIDAQKEYTFAQFGFVHRSGWTDTGDIEVYVSSDSENWGEAVGTFTLAMVGTNQIFTIAPKQGRYIKVIVTRSNRDNNASLAEIYAYGKQ